MEHVYKDIDLSWLEYDGPEELQNALKYAITEHGYCMFPQAWGFANSDGFNGDTPSDPLTIYIALGLELGFDDSTVFKTSLSEIWEDMLDGISTSDGAIDDEHHARDVRKITTALRALADEMDSHIKI